jgi:hypothetical protein
MKMQNWSVFGLISMLFAIILLSPAVWAAEAIVIGVPTSTGFLEGRRV